MKMLPALNLIKVLLCCVTGHPCEERENPADFLLDLIKSFEKEASMFVEINPQVCFVSNNDASLALKQTLLLMLHIIDLWNVE